MTTLIRNKTKSSLVLPIPGGSVTFLPHGDPGHRDMVSVVDSVIETPECESALSQGLLEVVVEREVVEAEVMAARQRASEEAEEQTREALQQTLNPRPQSRDLLGLSCIGPREGKPNMQCGVPVSVPSSVEGSVPPLCGKHEDLAYQYSAYETTEPGATPDDPYRPVIRWTKVQVGGPVIATD